MKTRWTTLGLWLAVGCIAVLSCSLTRPAGHAGEDYFPVGNDSFYHAVRILSAANDPAAFYEFDPKIHAPEGSLLVWPWGYDYAIAKIVRAGIAIGLGTDPLMIMLWIPVVAVFFSTGLLMLLARRLGLSDWPVALAGLCMALNASTQLIYGFGQIDHHYAEHMFIIASIVAGLAWFRAPGVAAGVALGVIFGLALAVHNALFILQAPFLATALLQWLQGKRAPLRPVVGFAIALIGAALAVLLPSQPFQEGRFEFYMLSWFHLYIVCCTALVMVLLTRLQPTRRGVATLVLVAALLLTPLLKQIAYAQSFVAGSLGMLDQILEMRSPVLMLRDGDIMQVMGFYSLLVFVGPITFVLCAVRLWRERQGPRLLFWVWCVFGLMLLTTQIRMHYFGVFALFLPWLIVAQEYSAKHPELHKRTLLATSLALVIAYIPVIRYALVAPVPRGGEQWFMPLYPMFAPLRQACEADPGVVLADTNAGHYIRYFTGCSVIANNFLLTEQQFQKADEVGRLFALPAEQLIQQAPFIKYVVVRTGNIVPKEDGHFSYEFYGQHPAGLSNTLLLGPAGDVPPEFKLLYEVSIQVRELHTHRLREVPYAKLYKLERRGAAPPPASANDVSE